MLWVFLKGATTGATAVERSLHLTQPVPIEATGALTTTHSSLNAGEEIAGRILIAVLECSGGSSSHITGVTIGGVTATRRAGRTNGDFVQTDIWSAVVPTGTSVDVTVTRSTGTNAAIVFLYSAIGYNNTNWTGGTDFQASNTSTALMDVTLDIPSDATGIAIYSGANIQQNASRTWTGLVSENVDYEQVDATGTAVSGDIKLTTLASDTDMSGGSTNISFNTSDTTRRRPSFAAVAFT
jgi:hypothetical protein